MHWAPVEPAESHEAASQNPQAACVTPQADSSATPQAGPVPRNGSLESYMQIISHVTPVSTIPQPAAPKQVNEARLYLDTVSEPYSQDPLLWWSAHEDQYPHLARMAVPRLSCNLCVCREGVLLSWSVV